MVRKIYKNFALLIVSSVLIACSQNPPKNPFGKYQDIERVGTASLRVARKDYEVIKTSASSSSSQKRPKWISHPQKFGAELLLKKSRKGKLLFSFETGPKTNKGIACTMARAYTRQDLANFLIQFYRKGEEERPWDAYLMSEGHEFLKTFFKKAKLNKTYWERRLYAPELGHEEKTNAYVCALLVSISESSFIKAMRTLRKKIIKRFSYQKRADLVTLRKVLDPKIFIFFYKMNY